MDKNTRIAFRILASLYPDRKPSEVKKIIEDALAKEECQEDVELWMVLTKEKAEKQEPAVVEKVIEHHYHHYNNWWTTTTPSLTDRWTITCDNSSACDITASADSVNITY